MCVMTVSLQSRTGTAQDTDDDVMLHAAELEQVQRDRVARAQDTGRAAARARRTDRMESPTRFSFIALVMPTKAREPFCAPDARYGQEGIRWRIAPGH